jgi:hypothetical protein
MDSRLSALLAANEHAVCRRSVLAEVADHVLEHAVRTGALTQLLPNVYVSTDVANDVRTRERAALLYAGEEAALSHVTALRRWDCRFPTQWRRSMSPRLTPCVGGDAKAFLSCIAARSRSSSCDAAICQSPD